MVRQLELPFPELKQSYFLNKNEPLWSGLWLCLCGGLIFRIAIALSGDYVIHPDEIMQYLEPAHRLVFGNSITYWEFYYGGRSLLIPGLLSLIIKTTDIVGFGEPQYYIVAVKVFLCLLSMSIPLSMYMFARFQFGALAAIWAVILGSFWYELAGFSSKPMSEHISVALFAPALAIAAGPATISRWFLAGFLLAITMAIRIQYGPVVAIVGIAMLIKSKPRQMIALVTAGLTTLVAVGLFDMITWGEWFHSYLLNLRANFELNIGRAGESSHWLYMAWLFIASGSLAYLAFFYGLLNIKKYGLLIALMLTIIIVHSVFSHKEYRFIFLITPIWLLIMADMLARLNIIANDVTESKNRIWHTAFVASITMVSGLGILNALPLQGSVYYGFSNGTNHVRFVHSQDAMFDVCRRLAKDPSVTGVWFPSRLYFNTCGYYYIHKKIPVYDQSMPTFFKTDDLRSYVSHIVSENPLLYSPPGFILEQTIYRPQSDVTPYIEIWKRARPNPLQWQWRHYEPLPDLWVIGRLLVDGELQDRIAKNLGISLIRP